MLFDETIRLLAEEPFYTNIAVAFGSSIILSSVLAALIVREDNNMSNKTITDRISGINIHGGFMAVSKTITNVINGTFDGVGLLVQACWSTTTLIVLQMTSFIFSAIGLTLNKGFEFVGACVDETVPFIRGFIAPFKAVWEHIPSFSFKKTETEVEEDHSWIHELDEELNQPSEIDLIKAEMAEMKKQIDQQNEQIDQLTTITAVQTKRIGRLEWKVTELKTELNELKSAKVEPVLEDEDEGIVEMIVQHAAVVVKKSIEDFDMNSKEGRKAARQYLLDQGVNISRSSNRSQIAKGFDTLS